MRPASYTRRTSWMVPSALPVRDGRRAVRRAVRVPMEVYVAHLREPVACWTRDISPLGAWLEAAEPLEKGDPVLLSFRPPRWPTRLDLTIPAHVVRISRGRRASDDGRPGFAVAFQDLSHAERAELGRCLAGFPPPLSGARAVRDSKPA